MKVFSGLLSLSLLVVVLFTGCEKSIIVDDPGVLDNRNIYLRTFTYWNNYFINKDSVYTKNGASFKIDDVKLLLSDFYYSDAGDTLKPQNDFTLTSLNSNQFKLGLITENNISGSVNFTVGLNSVVNQTEPDMYEAGHVLANEDIWGGRNKGYHFITIEGRIFNPSKPNETEPSIPLKWVVATDALASKLGIEKNFSIATGKPVLIDAIFDVSLLFDDLYPLANPVIKSDPGDANDIALAGVLRNNFVTKAFLLR